MSSLITTEKLQEWLDSGRKDLRVIDASWHMPASGRNARQEYENEHIPGAVFFDIDAISDKESQYPHMFPDPHQFAHQAGELGIGTEDVIVVYDTAGLFSAGRAWWMFRVLDHVKIFVLDGGLPKWKAEGRKTENRKVMPIQTFYESQVNPYPIKFIHEMEKVVKERSCQLVDARSAARFSGKEPEPRAGLRSGHIPGAKNVHYGALLNPPYNTLKPPQELQKIFMAAGVDISRPVIASCGSGITACILALALEEMGSDDWSVYDGSWAEWGSRADLPIEK